jgi:hypothetical protein
VGNIKKRIISESLSSHTSRHLVSADSQTETRSRAGDPAGAKTQSNGIRVVHETQGAMTQQCSDAAHGHESMPQKLPQLVGCRDPEARSASSRRPARNGTG